MSALSLRHPVEDPAPRAWSRALHTLEASARAPAILWEPERIHQVLQHLGRQGGGALDAEADWLRLHRFEPQGLSAVVALSGVRVVFHTWPERGLATLDVSASDPVALERWCDGVSRALGLSRVQESLR